MVVLRKRISESRGQKWLLDVYDYFFYITNDWIAPAAFIVFDANQRCNQENLISELSSGVRALHAPVNGLISNWAYMVIASLAWTFKAWFGLLQPRQKDRNSVLSMKFKRFLNSVILIPCQVVRSARRVTLRFLAYTDCIRLLFRSLDGTARIRAP